MKDIADYLEKEQVDQILGVAKACSVRDYLMLRILWRAGCRVSELLNIAPSDIEFNNQIVNITRAKGGKQRRVLLDEETLTLLSEYISSSNIREDQSIFWHQTVSGSHPRQEVRPHGQRRHSPPYVQA